MTRLSMVLLSTALACSLTACADRAKSVENGNVPPGEGAGPRGGQNSGDTRVNGQPPGSGNAEGTPDPTKK